MTLTHLIYLTAIDFFKCLILSISYSFSLYNKQIKSSLSNQPFTYYLQICVQVDNFLNNQKIPPKAPPPFFLPSHAKIQTYSSSLASSVRALRRAPSTAGALNPMAAHLAFRMRLKSGLTRETMRNRDLTSMGRLQPGGAVSLL